MGANPLLGYYTRIKCIAQRRRHYLVCARTGGHPRPDTYSTTRTRWGTLATMPRMDGVSSRSTIWLRRVKPRPLMTSLCLTGVQIFERKYCNLILAVAFLVAMKELLGILLEGASLELVLCLAAQGGDFGF